MSDDDNHFTLEEREERDDDYPIHQGRGRRNDRSRRSSRSVSSETVSSSNGGGPRGVKDLHRRDKKERRRARKQREYEQAVRRYEQHKIQEGYYTDTYGTNSLGDAADIKRGISNRKHHPSSASRSAVKMFNMPQEAYFGDVETDGSGVGVGSSNTTRRPTTPNRSGRQNPYHAPPPSTGGSFSPRVSQPRIATPLRHDVATSRAPLLEGAARGTPHRSPISTSQIWRGPVSSTPTPLNSSTLAKSSAPPTNGVQRGGRTGSPFDHRDRSIL
jgi:hypothetical protein